MESKRLQTAKKYIGHFETLDTEAVASLLTEDHVHQFAPASLDPPGPYTRREFLDHSARLRRMLEGFPVRAREYVEGEAANQVTVWATSRARFREEVKGGDGEGAWAFEGEYVFMFWMDESGERIRRTVEFLDSKATENVLRPLLERVSERIGMETWGGRKRGEGV